MAIVVTKPPKPPVDPSKDRMGGTCVLCECQVECLRSDTHSYGGVPCVYCPHCAPVRRIVVSKMELPPVPPRCGSGTRPKQAV